MKSFDLSPDRSKPCYFTEILCPLCTAHLEVHLPDPHLPDRQLGTCPRCKAWFLMHAEGGKMWLLPELDSAECDGEATSGGAPASADEGR